jgi:shikimate dehydrogenase
MKKFGVIGYPLTHSLSPQIHNYAFQNLHIDATYEKIEIFPADFDKSILRLKQSDLSGFNVTIPFKNQVIDLLDEVDHDATVVGAVNTVVAQGDRWLGYNTDIAGFIFPLRNTGRHFRKCLVLGTGGAARAVIYALGNYYVPGEIMIAGRDIKKAGDLCTHFRSYMNGTTLNHCAIDNVYERLQDFDLIVNVTPLGTFPAIESSVLPDLVNLKEGVVVYDLVYNPIKTKLLQDAEKAGKDVVLLNGMEMLLRQAAYSFKIWTGEEMPIDRVRNTIISEFTR